MNKIIRKMTLTGLLAAITFLLTYFVRIPVLAGYVNLGDAVIMFAAVFIDPVAGALVGLLGATSADIVAGYGAYAPFTAVIKVAEALIAGYLSRALPGKIKGVSLYIAGLVMAIGYGFTNWLLFSWQALWVPLMFDVIQAIVAASLALSLLAVSKKIHLLQPED